MPAIISPELLKRESPNFVCRYNISIASLGMTDYSLMNCHVTCSFEILPPIISLELMKLGTSYFIFHVLIDTQKY